MIYIVLQYIFYAVVRCGTLPSSEINFLWQLYNNTGGDNWLWRPQTSGEIWTFNKLNQSNPCAPLWQGLNCSSCSSQSSTCHVLEISLSQYGMKGILPNTLSQIPLLQYLNLNSNSLTGPIPSSLGSLSNLQYLCLGLNQLTDPVPSSVGALSNLQYFGLNNNELTGAIPSSLGSLSNLQYFYLSVNQLTGPIPSSVGALSNLQELFLYNNDLTGSIPSSLGSLSNLQYLLLHDNLLSSPIPPSLGSLSYLQYLYLSLNELTGSIPSSLGLLSNLIVLYLSCNRQLRSSIPASFGSLSSLKYLYLNSNDLTGSIPSSVGSLSNLQDLYLNNNKLTGSIPSSLGSLSALQYFDVNSNELTGSIPSSLGSLSALQYLDLYRNMLTGLIPSSLGLLSALIDLAMYDNRLTGSIPSSLVSLSILQGLYISVNDLTGSIPSSLGSLSYLQYLYLSLNELTGSIPSSLGLLSCLQYMHSSSNALTGSIPSSLGSLSTLQDFLFHENQLTGSIPSSLGLLSTLQAVDLSFNQLTGSIPCFSSSLRLQSLILASNCFRGSLPDCLCEVSALQTLVVSGLTSAASCSYPMFYNPSIRVNRRSITGQLPSCLFSMANLVSLYADGNGISSLLPDSTLSPSLVNVSLSYNRLRGNIPDSWKRQIFWLLDLASNELSGTLNGIVAEILPDIVPFNLTYLNVSNHSSLYLGVNRISGNIPSNISNDQFSRHSLSILTGNLFACNTPTSKLPREDVDSDIYSCGSDALNNDIYLWLSAVSLLIGLSIFLFWRSSGGKNSSIGTSKGLFRLSLQLLDWRERSSDIESVHVFHRVMSLYRWHVLILTLILLSVHLPVYSILKVWYATHSYEYGWYPSLAYMEGLVPAVMTVLCFMLLWGVLFYFVYRGQYDTQYARSNPLDSTIRNIQSISWSALALFAVSCVIVVVVNGGYVYVILTQKLSIQNVAYVMLVIFKLVWNQVVYAALLNYDMTWRFLAFVCNLILIPVLATMAVDPSCFYNLLIPPTEVVSHYYSTNCFFVRNHNFTENVACRALIPQTTSFIPSFRYSYQCGSSVLTNYVPVYVTLYTISGVLIPLILCAVAVRFDNTETRRFREWVPGKLLPLKLSDSEPVLYDIEKLCLNLTVSMVVLMVFGTGYPLLSLVVFLSVLMTSLTTQVFIEKHREQVQVSDDKYHLEWEANLAKECLNLQNILYSYMRYVLILGGLFLFLFVLDQEHHILSGVILFALILVIQIVLIRFSNGAVSRTTDEVELSFVVSSIHGNFPK